MKDFGLTMGTLDKTKSGLTKIEVSNIMRVVCGKLNNTPYAAQLKKFFWHQLTLDKTSI